MRNMLSSLNNLSSDIFNIMTNRLSFPSLLLVAAFAGCTAHAAEPMSAEDFDAYTLGKTLFYGREGQAYGVEKYLPGRKVIWSFLDGQCQHGDWYPEGEQICFVYENQHDPQCWRFSLTPEGLRAQFENRSEATQLYETDDPSSEMICLVPDVGV